MLQFLLVAGNVSTYFVVFALCAVEQIAFFLMLQTQAFDFGIGGTLFSHMGFELGLMLGNFQLAHAVVRIQGLPFQGLQLRLFLALLGF